ncbi:MAG TPA: thioredoxin domain-containing protein [Gammaproteobacteria bacterium]
MTNRLAHETSPYLQQHAENPVEWHPWDQEALQLARRRERPILLSIGYSACHWCHVMAHESFEDQATAELMNRLFVNIKVDREERPDLDKIYQAAHYLIARRPGGWPLTVFLDADTHLPIFAGTYFPREQFRELLRRVDEFARTHAEDIETQGEAIRQALASLDPSADAGAVPDFGDAPLELARNQLESSFDSEFGGFGGAPKFPHPTNIETLLSAWRATAESKSPDLKSLYMATFTLTRMASGGLFDQLGGGFFRYSVDRYWAIPHFEKMLYDNAALLTIYCDAHAATGEPFFARIASETADWAIRDMQDPAGGYYATLDADSEGEEGLFYLWTPSEMQNLLTPEESRVALEHYGMSSAPNFEGKAWHLHAAVAIDNLESGLSPTDAQAALESARGKLLAARGARIWPGRDEKILTSWNGLMIKAMARASRVLERPDLAESADAAARFVRQSLWKDGRLLASFKDGRARFAAYLDDYAFMADGLLELLRCRWNTRDLDFACELVEVLLDRFQDPDGGFFFTADDHETLIHRPKPFSDEATPAGNGVAASVLLKLGHLLGETRYIDAAHGTLRAAWPAVSDYPHAHGTLLAALRDVLAEPETIVIRGTPEASTPWARYVNAGFNPGRLCFTIPEDAADLPALLAAREPRDDVTAYFCRGMTCSEPITNLEDLASSLGETARRTLA